MSSASGWPLLFTRLLWCFPAFEFVLWFWYVLEFAVYLFAIVFIVDGLRWLFHLCVDQIISSQCHFVSDRSYSVVWKRSFVALQCGGARVDL